MTYADGLDGLLAEQVAYYRARASEYDAGAVTLPGGNEVVAALDAFRPTGDVLELACGTGGWTAQLLRHAGTVTAVDFSPEMLDLARRRVGNDPRVRFVVADLFTWRPERRYDVVFFGFWISHVPMERFDAFWEFVDECLAPGGRVFFADDAYRMEDELIEGPESAMIERRLEDGTRFRVIKVRRPPAPVARARVEGRGPRDRRPVLLGSRYARLAEGWLAPAESAIPRRVVPKLGDRAAAAMIGNTSLVSFRSRSPRTPPGRSGTFQLRLAIVDGIRTYRCAR